jgi:hypothetical protein
LGIQGSGLRLIESYLQNRYAFTAINNVESKRFPVTRGVPQGGCLSSTLFTAYTADVRHLPLDGKLCLFADDSSIVNSAKSMLLLKSAIESDLSMFYNWCTYNELCLNCDKTMIVVAGIVKVNFEIKLHVHGCDKLANCSCLHIKIVDKCKYLGIWIDRSLNFDHHVNSITATLRSALAALIKLSYIKNKKIMILFYLSCFQSHLDYCLSIWGNLSKARCLRLLKLQKHAVRLITQSHRLAHTHSLFSELCIMPFSIRFLYRFTLYVYKRHMDRLIITPTNSIRFLITHRLIIPQQHCLMYSRSFPVLSIRIFNWGGAELFERRISSFKSDLSLKLWSLYDTADGVEQLLKGIWTS